MRTITIKGVYKGIDPRGIIVGGIPFRPLHIMTTDVTEDVFKNLLEVSNNKGWFNIMNHNYDEFLKANNRAVKVKAKKEVAKPVVKEVKEEVVKEVKEEVVKEVKEEVVKEVKKEVVEEVTEEVVEEVTEEVVEEVKKEVVEEVKEEVAEPVAEEVKEEAPKTTRKKKTVK